MRYGVNPMHQTRENGPKPRFWLFGSFKKAFFWFLNDPAWVVWKPNRAHHLVLSKYAISSRSDAPNSRNWPKPIWIIQKGRNAYTRRTENFFKNQPDFSRTCGFRGKFTESLNFQNIHFKSTNQWQTFRQKSKKCHFWHVFVIIEWSRFFLGNPALLLRPTHCPLSSCQVFWKS